MKRDQRGHRRVVAGRDDQGAEDEEGEHLEDRAHVLREVGEPLGDLVLGDPERDPEDERGDQPVAEGDVREPEGDEPEADGVDALVPRRDAPRDDAMQPAAEDAEHDPDHGAERRLADELSGLAAGVAAGRGEDEEEEHERQREPVVEPGLEVERVADRLRDRARRDHRGGDHGVGGAEDRAEQERLGPGRGRRRAACADQASSTRVIGIAITSARAGGPQWRPSSSRSTSSPSETRVRISASSISSTIPSSPTSTETTSSSASTIPSAIESTDAESTVPRIRPESAAVTASSAPKISAASPKERSISARTSRRSRRSCGSRRPRARRRRCPGGRRSAPRAAARRRELGIHALSAIDIALHDLVGKQLGRPGLPAPRRRRAATRSRRTRRSSRSAAGPHARRADGRHRAPVRASARGSASAR